jgi:hypothetical protein
MNVKTRGLGKVVNSEAKRRSSTDNLSMENTKIFVSFRNESGKTKGFDTKRPKVKQ